MLRPGRKAQPFVEDYLILLYGFLALLWLGYRRDELCRPSLVKDFMGGLALLVQFPVQTRALVGRVQYGLIKKWIGHVNLICYRLRRCLMLGGQSSDRCLLFGLQLLPALRVGICLACASR